MITLTLPVWVCWLIIITYILNTITQGLEVYNIYLDRKIKKEKEKFKLRGPKWIP